MGEKAKNLSTKRRDDRNPSVVTSLAEVLQSRDLRVARQSSLLVRWGQPVICLTLVSPGPVKDSALRRRLMDRAEAVLSEKLAAGCHGILERFRIDSTTGAELFMAVDCNPYDLKRIAMSIEEEEPWGRLIDADVLRGFASLAGETIPESLRREDLGEPPRRCLLCGNAAAVCMACRRHGLAEIMAEVDRLLSTLSRPAKEKTKEKAATSAGRIAALAVTALSEEAALFDKPGLVCPDSRGSHSDMEYRHFLVSARALAPCMEACAATGAAFHGDDPKKLLASLRTIGIAGESAMLNATGGVNTHKGAIFCLGLLAAASANIASGPRHQSEPAGDSACLLAGSMCAGIVQAELPASKNSVDTDRPRLQTNGERLYGELGVRGIRGEAQDGFPVLRRRILPILRAARRLDSGAVKAARLDALLWSMVELEDSCIISRGGMEGLSLVRKGAERVLCLGGAASASGITALAELNALLVEKHLSPGGSADMLAAGIFLDCFERSLQAE